ncbi:hypothetical protein [Enemella sp. A6]|uniref:hypothetical protein n=1 Tax=Enemella sp. A6 TaxID=3440152 RepID=UPI003EB94AD6
MKRVLGTWVLLGLAGLVALITLLAIFLTNVTGAPQPDGDPTRYKVVEDHVQLQADTSYELGVVLDPDHPEYEAGRTLPAPTCRVSDADGELVHFDAVDRKPRMHEFTRYARFTSAAAGRYGVVCRDDVGLILPTELVVQRDVWVTHRAEEARRTGRMLIIGGVGAVVFIFLVAAAIRIGSGRLRPDRQGVR